MCLDQGRCGGFIADEQRQIHCGSRPIRIHALVPTLKRDLSISGHRLTTHLACKANSSGGRTRLCFCS